MTIKNNRIGGQKIRCISLWVPIQWGRDETGDRFAIGFLESSWKEMVLEVVWPVVSNTHSIGFQRVALQAAKMWQGRFTSGI
jgi:hypothetical protein